MVQYTKEKPFSPVADEEKKEKKEEMKNDVKEEEEEVKLEILWLPLLFVAVQHVVAVIGLLNLGQTHPATIAFSIVLYFASLLGVNAGTHRLFTHRSYKARLPLRAFLIFLFDVSGQGSVFSWVRDHRVHHKCTDTNADPHNSKRGFLFSQYGWYFCQRHPSYHRELAKVDTSDLVSDPLIMLHHKYYPFFVLTASSVIPTLVPWYFWGESLWLALLSSNVRRLASIHVTGFVNSLAHMWGERPYDVNIAPTEIKWLSLLNNGEGFHNYHHAFPQDYSASEWRYSLNVSTLFIDTCCLLGLAYDRRFVSDEAREARIRRTGPGSTKVH